MVIRLPAKTVKGVTLRYTLFSVNKNVKGFKKNVDLVDLKQVAYQISNN